VVIGVIWGQNFKISGSRSPGLARTLLALLRGAGPQRCYGPNLGGTLSGSARPVIPVVLKDVRAACAEGNFGVPSAVAETTSLRFVAVGLWRILLAGEDFLIIQTDAVRRRHPADCWRHPCLRCPRTEKKLRISRIRPNRMNVVNS
jgi:hypothetical protein